MKRLLEYLQLVKLEDLSQVEQAKYLVYFFLKTQNKQDFRSTDLTNLFIDANLNKPNCSRLLKKLLEFKYIKSIKSGFSLTSLTEQKLKIEFKNFFETEEIDSKSILLDESKFESKFDYIFRLVKEINFCYEYNCFTATAVLMRRLFEICIIHTFINAGIVEEIRDKDGYFMLDKLIKNITSNEKIKLSRIKNKYPDFQKIGNYAAHRLEYITSKKDIDDIKLDFRTALEELFYKGDLIKK